MGRRRCACDRPAMAASPATGASRRLPSATPSFQPTRTASSGCRSRGAIRSARSPPPTCCRASVSKTALDGRIAIVGTSAPGLLDLRATPLDPVISGVEINALALEQLLSKRLLVRPDYRGGNGDRCSPSPRRCCWACWFIDGVPVSRRPSVSSRSAYSRSAACGRSRAASCSMPCSPIITSSAAYIFGTGYLYYEAEIGTQPRARNAAAHRPRDGSRRPDPAHLPAQGGPARTLREQVRDLRGHEARQGRRRRLLRLLPHRRQASSASPSATSPAKAFRPRCS